MGFHVSKRRFGLYDSEVVAPLLVLVLSPAHEPEQEEEDCCWFEEVGEVGEEEVEDS